MSEKRFIRQANLLRLFTNSPEDGLDLVCTPETGDCDGGVFEAAAMDDKI